MGMYVKEFDFKKTAADMSADKCAGYSKGGNVSMKTSGYAKGGSVKEKATGESYASREAMMKSESKETPRMQREEMTESRKVVGPARRSVPVAPTGPLLAMKKGGMAKGGMHSMPDGKMMKNSAMKDGGAAGKMSDQKQVVSAAMSEARKASKR